MKSPESRCCGIGSAIAAVIAAALSSETTVRRRRWIRSSRITGCRNTPTDLLDLLNVLGRLIALEPKQADLLNRICAGPLRSADELRDAGALAMLDEKSVTATSKSKGKA